MSVIKMLLDQLLLGPWKKAAFSAINMTVNFLLNNNYVLHHLISPFLSVMRILRMYLIHRFYNESSQDGDHMFLPPTPLLWFGYEVFS